MFGKGGLASVLFQIFVFIQIHHWQPWTNPIRLNLDGSCRRDNQRRGYKSHILQQKTPLDDIDKDGVIWTRKLTYFFQSVWFEGDFTREDMNL